MLVAPFVCCASARTAQAQSALADRIQAGDRKAALAMIAEGRDVNQTQPTARRRCTGPSTASIANWSALLEEGRQAPTSSTSYGASPLAEAVRVANLELVGMLLEAGADANVANEDGQTALMLAARTGNVAVAKLLVQHGADVNRRESYRDQSAVMWAAARGPRGHGGVPGVAEGRPDGAREGQRVDDADLQRAARAVSADRWPDAAALCRAGRLPCAA